MNKEENAVHESDEPSPIRTGPNTVTSSNYTQCQSVIDFDCRVEQLNTVEFKMLGVFDLPNTVYSHQKFGELDTFS